MNIEEYGRIWKNTQRLEKTCSVGYSVKQQHSSANFETKFQNMLLAVGKYIVDFFYYKPHVLFNCKMNV